MATWTIPHSSPSSLRGPVHSVRLRSKVDRVGVPARAILGKSRLLCENWSVGSSSPDSHPSEGRSFSLDTAGVLLQQRIVFLGSQVDDISADLIISQLLLLDAKDPTKDIKMFINSPGGSVSAGMGIYDAMKLCRADVSTICFGLAASMGAFLLASGTKGKRYCMPNARVMIHQPLGGAGGAAIDVGIQVREMMYHKFKLNKILSRLTGKPEEQVEADTDRDYFMNAWEAVDYGLVDAVIDDGKPGLVAPMGEAKEPPKTRVSDFWTIKDGKRYRPSEESLSSSDSASSAASTSDSASEKAKTAV